VILFRVQLSELERVGNLGTGGFGQVVLVRRKEPDNDKEELYALKLLHKKQVVGGEQQEAVIREAELLRAVRDSKLALHLYTSMQVGPILCDCA